MLIPAGDVIIYGTGLVSNGGHLFYSHLTKGLGKDLGQNEMATYRSR
jgi:hypothetical protein